MKTISHSKGLLHIETPLGIINVDVGLGGLRDMRERLVEVIEIIPNNYAGEKKVKISGCRISRLIQLKGRP